MTTGIMKKENGHTSMPAASFSGLVDRLFQNNISRFLEDDFWGFNGVAQRNFVPVNLSETSKSFEMQLVAPGLKKEDFRINLEKDLLTVSYEQKEETTEEEKEERWLRKEFRNLSFSRTFTLDDTLDPEKITASYKDGILHLTLPKKEGAHKLYRNIEIN